MVASTAADVVHRVGFEVAGPQAFVRRVWASGCIPFLQNSIVLFRIEAGIYEVSQFFFFGLESRALGFVVRGLWRAFGFGAQGFLIERVKLGN